MRIYIMTDLEGVAGVNGRSDGIGNKTVNLDIACRRLEAEVNACCEGLFEAGATEIVVWDGHGGSNSIDINRLHARVSLGNMGGGLAPIGRARGFDAAIQLGTHAMQGVADGYMNHSFNSHATAEIRLNGEPIGEIGIGILLAAYFDVPSILVSGDQAACREAKEFLQGQICTVETKRAYSRYTVVNHPLETVAEELRQGAKNALLKLKQFPLKKIAPPYEMRYQVMCPNHADMAEKMGIERLDHQTLLYRSDNIVDLWAQRNGWAPGVHNRKFNI